MCCTACFFPHFPSSAQKGLDVVSTSSTTNTSYPGSCELPRTRPRYFLSSLLEQSVLGSCHLSYPGPWPPSNCSSEALSHPGAGSLKRSPNLCPNNSRGFINLLPQPCSTLIAQQPSPARGLDPMLSLWLLF